MAEDTLQAAVALSDSAPDVRLDSWKEIAAYLKRDVTTVRRWEKREGLPVHRHLHKRRDSVYAYTTEINDWWQGRRNHLADNGVPEGVSPGAEDEPSTSAATPEPHQRPRHPRARLAWTLASSFFVMTLVLTALLALTYRPSAPAEGGELRFLIVPPERTSVGTVSISPDGRQMAFTGSTEDGKTLLWIRPLGGLAAQPFPDTEGATFPFWSPNSDAVGFFAGGKLWTVDVAEGNPRLICDAPNGRGGTWSRGGIIVFAPGREGELFRVSASGGSPTPVTAVNRADERGHMWPEFLPDGKRFLYLSDSSKPEHHNLFVGTLDETPRKRLFSLLSNASYGRDYLFFVRDRRLVAQRFDASRLGLIGEPVAVADTVFHPALDHKMQFSVSANGVLVYHNSQGPTTQLVWRDRAGYASPLTTTPAEYYEPTLSPDEQRVVIDVFDPRPSQRFGFGGGNVRSDIHLLDRSTGEVLAQVTSDPAADFDPVWSPDGSRVAFSSNRGGILDLYQTQPNGAGTEELLFASALDKHAQAWSPDGRFLVYATFEPNTRGDLWLLPMVGDRTPVALLRTEFNEEQAQISPSGRWLAYTSQVSERSEVYVTSFPQASEQWRISPNGGGDARWSTDGTELFYIAEDRRLMAVAVKTGATFERGDPVPLFDTAMGPHWFEGRNHYDVSRDGRFLFMIPVADDRSLPFTVVVNWAARLRK